MDAITEQNTCSDCGKTITGEFEECEGCGEILCYDCVNWDGELHDVPLCKHCYESDLLLVD